MSTGYLVKKEIDGAHPKLADYPLLEGDLLVREDDGTYSKVCPGIQVCGFQLTDEEQQRLETVNYRQSHLGFHYTTT